MNEKDLNGLKLPELQAVAAEIGIKSWRKFKKQELLDEIRRNVDNGSRKTSSGMLSPFREPGPVLNKPPAQAPTEPAPAPAPYDANMPLHESQQANANLFRDQRRGNGPGRPQRQGAFRE